MRISVILSRLLLVLAIVGVVVQSRPVTDRLTAPHDRRKHLAGPPSEFELHALPSPKSAAVSSSGALFPVVFERDFDGQWKSQFAVDSRGLFTVTVLSPITDLDVKFLLPSSADFTPAEDLLPSFAIVHEDSFGFGDAMVPSTTYMFENPERGLWNILISLPEHEAPTSDRPQAFLLMKNAGSSELTASLRSYDLHVGSIFAIDAWMQHPMMNAGSMMPEISFAQIELELPDGRYELVQMEDGGVGADIEANDGIYAAAYELPVAGDYIARVEVHGTLGDGTPMIRTAQLLFSAASPDVILQDRVDAEIVGQDIWLNIEVDWTPTTNDRTVYAYAEVWGLNTDGMLVPVAWVAGMVDIMELNAGHFITLTLDKDWLHNAQASLPLVLRNVRIQDRSTFVPLSQLPEVIVKTRNYEEFPAPTTEQPKPITERMLMGPRPAELSASNGNGTLILVHGYCAARPGPFPTKDFTNYSVFEDFETNRRTDEFAILLMKFGERFPAFSLVGHFQGGLASVHLHAFYWSKLDNANGGRLMQSVGAPYQGTALAGNLAVIGKIFGAGCGTNAGMTHDGAALWLSTIPQSSRQEMYHYTTQYSTSGLVHYCHAAANAILAWPNDGVVENDYANLPGGIFMGNAKGWCHVTDMRHPPQTTDTERNRIMNLEAAR